MNEPPFPSPALHPPIVAIMGADGCGKTTVIETLKAQLEHPWNIQVCSVHRVHDRRHKEDYGHYSKPAHSFVISIAKLIFMGIEWTFKYFKTFSRLQRQGQLVLCDRHYFYSMAIDPLRYRYSGPVSLVRSINKLIPQPDVFILLDAPLEVLVSRKREISDEQIQRLIEAYRELFKRLPSAHIVDASRSIDEVTADVLQIILNYA